MKKLLLAISILVSGCATPQQNAALIGATMGAMVGIAITENNQQPHHHRHRPIVYCNTFNELIGYDRYHRPIYQTRQVCREQ